MIKINENFLSNDLSPYLKQHKDNPVNWQIWSKETLEYSKQNKKPILLSIGYASCHWCHVMLTKVLRIRNSKINEQIFRKYKSRQKRDQNRFYFSKFISTI